MGYNSKSGYILVWLNGFYFRAYASYIFGITFLGAVAMWMVAPEGDLQFLDSLYQSAACVSQSGLSVVDWSKQSTPVHVISFFLIIGGSMSLLTVVPAILRTYSYRMQVIAEQERERSFTNESVEDGRIEEEDDADLDDIDRDARARSQKNAVADDNDSIPESVDSVATAWELEYAALGYVIKIVLGYWLVVHVTAITIVYCYTALGNFKDINDMFEPYGIQHLPHAIYFTGSSFQNNGLVITPASLENFNKHPVLLMTSAMLIICGNTGLPIGIRAATMLTWKLSPPGERKNALAFLLEHPRRCYTHMFPAMHTLWLMLVLLVLDGLPVLIMMWQDSDGSVMAGLDFSDKIWNCILNSVSARTAGVNSFDIYRLGIVSTYTLLVCMYINTTPTVVTMRYSAISDGPAELDITGVTEGVEDALSNTNTINSQARSYLTQDTCYLLVALFFMLVFESDGFDRTATQAAPANDGIYNDYDFIKMVFELFSAYGTVGLSLGYRNACWSFSGAWGRPAQFLLILVMLLGRLRGLPNSIDPSVATTMHREVSK
jgi:Trk-type K+ transport system membrane component